jgi:hypothetical protein
MLLAMAIGKLKQPESWALYADINMVLLCLQYHEEDLLKMAGIWPGAEKTKPKPTKNDLLSFARTQNALVSKGKIK